MAIVFLNSDERYWSWYNWNNHVNPPVLVIAAGLTYYSMKWFLQLTGDRTAPEHEKV